MTEQPARSDFGMSSAPGPLSDSAFAVGALGGDLAVPDREHVHEVHLEALAALRRPGGHRFDGGVVGTDEVADLVPANVGHALDQIENVVIAGIFTDQCVSSTVRSLADESSNVIVVEDCCAAATMELHEKELEIINTIYCHVAKLGEVRSFFA
jgi:Isochorismatase family